LLAVAMIALWVGTYFTRFIIAFRPPARGMYTHMEVVPPGPVRISRVWVGADPDYPDWYVGTKPYLVLQLPNEKKEEARAFFPLELAWVPVGLGASGWSPEYIAFPLLAPLVIFLAAGLLPPYLAWRRGWLRRRRGLCEKCGYDLRASPVRCPECGTVRTDVGKTVSR
jgi:hypothetical protein